jgi:predicted Fe-S protein YdhL (DUF1289 family)
MVENTNEPAGGIPSPCVRNCCLDAHGICLGCFRTVAEITQWHAASGEEKREILARCRRREIERCGRSGCSSSSEA